MVQRHSVARRPPRGDDQPRRRHLALEPTAFSGRQPKNQPTPGCLDLRRVV